MAFADEDEVSALIAEVVVYEAQVVIQNPAIWFNRISYLVVLLQNYSESIDRAENALLAG